MNRWKNLILDDYFPCFPVSTPIFGKSSYNGEFWVVLLEKAFAKMYGSYKRIETGNPRHSLIDITGCPTYTYELYKDEIKLLIEDGLFWQDLKKWHEKGFVIAAGTKEIKDKEKLDGLIREHAYTIIKVVNI